MQSGFLAGGEHNRCYFHSSSVAEEICLAKKNDLWIAFVDLEKSLIGCLEMWLVED